MGDIKKLKKKYTPPMHPWNKQAIEEEKKLKEGYGLKIKKEIYLANSFLKKYKDTAKRLIADRTAQGEKERKQMMTKLEHLGLLPAQAGLDDVLSLQLKDVLERRIQSLVFRKGMARTAHQARQLITHRHVAVGDKEITSPSRLLTKEEENRLIFKKKSPFADEAHPERIAPSPPPETKKTGKQKKEKGAKTEDTEAVLVVPEGEE